MIATADFRQMAQYIVLAICGLIMRTTFGLFRVAIGVIVAILSVIAFFGFVLWLFTL